jgi:hypothetical protein
MTVVGLVNVLLIALGNISLYLKGRVVPLVKRTLLEIANVGSQRRNHMRVQVVFETKHLG